MAADPKPRHYTVEEYLELDRNSPETKYEYYDGQIRLMSGGKNRHHIICANLISALTLALADKPCVVLTSDCRVQISAARYVHPDITVTCEPDEQDDDITRAPLIVFEVLSPSTEAFDRGQKAAYYHAWPTIMEYVLISQQEPLIEIQRRTQAATFWPVERYHSGDVLEMKSLGITVPLTTIYQKISFPVKNLPLSSPDEP